MTEKMYWFGKRVRFFMEYNKVVQKVMCFLGIYSKCPVCGDVVPFKLEDNMCDDCFHQQSIDYSYKA